jgi:hypothetical protein
MLVKSRNGQARQGILTLSAISVDVQRIDEPAVFGSDGLHGREIWEEGGLASCSSDIRRWPRTTSSPVVNSKADSKISTRKARRLRRKGQTTT